MHPTAYAGALLALALAACSDEAQQQREQQQRRERDIYECTRDARAVAHTFGSEPELERFLRQCMRAHGWNV